jgi:lipoprotein-anchoring transpeptidase ErfK/SrfK
LVGVALLANLVAACSGPTNASDKKDVTVQAAAVAVTPANGTANVVPEDGVHVTSTGGELTSVTVAAGTDSDAGTFATGNTSWQTNWALKPGVTYTVTAVAKNKSGKSTTSSTTFTTKKPSSNHLEIADMTPSRGQTVGVGMPLDVTFNHDVGPARKAAVEKAMQVESTDAVTGAWSWVSDDEVLFRPKQYWPAHETVRLVAHLTGVQASPGVTGVKDYTQQFKIGDSQVVKVNLTTHQAKFYINGRVTHTGGVSAGMGGVDGYGNNLWTMEGTDLIMGKSYLTVMTSPNIQPNQPGYYHENIYYTTQITDSGEYLHQTPGQEYCLGHENCSHGCVRMSTAIAMWWYHTALVGSPVTVTQKGNPRPAELGNGWTYWDESWPKWLKDSHSGAVTTSSLNGTLPSNATNAPTITPSTSATPTTAG